VQQRLLVTLLQKNLGYNLRNNHIPSPDWFYWLFYDILYKKLFFKEIKQNKKIDMARKKLDPGTKIKIQAYLSTEKINTSILTYMAKSPLQNKYNFCVHLANCERNWNSEN